MILIAGNSFTLLVAHNFYNTHDAILLHAASCMQQVALCMGQVACSKLHRVWGKLHAASCIVYGASCMQQVALCMGQVACNKLHRVWGALGLLLFMGTHFLKDD